MAVVSVRVDDGTLTVLRSHKVNVSEIARAALMHEARRWQALDGLTRLRSWAAPPGEESSTRMVRRLRDER